MLYAFLKKILFSRYHKHVRTTYVYGKSESLFIVNQKDCEIAYSECDCVSMKLE